MKNTTNKILLGLGIFVIIFIAVWGIVIKGVFNFYENDYNKYEVSVGCIECEGCGCDVSGPDGFLGNSDFHVVFSCLAKYPEKPETIDDIYLLTDSEIKDAKKVISEYSTRKRRFGGN